jgi:hypothetical protein
MSLGFMTSAELLASIKLRAAVPISSITFSDEDLLSFAQEETELKLLPSILAVKEEFYVTLATIPLVENQSDYEIPYRAIGNKVRSVFYEQQPGTMLTLANVPIELMNNYTINTFPYQFAGFVLENDHLKLVPRISSGVNGNLLLRYYLRPNKIVKMARGARIRSIDRTTGVIEVSNGATGANTVPSNITITTQIDFIKGKSTNKTYSFDIDPAAVNASGGTITFATGSIPEQLVVGDWICNAGETVIPQVPPELHVMLAQAVACRVLESLGDTQGLQNANQKLAEMEQKLLSVIDTRVESPFRKIVTTNSILVKGRVSRRRYY